jgi:Zn-dependent M16 (insulinase) family peptidase
MSAHSGTVRYYICYPNFALSFDIRANSLVFLGSEKYPYKGILDQLANRAFASGTNAFTSETLTSYEIKTAGQDGFLRFLPGMLIIFPVHNFFYTITYLGVQFTSITSFIRALRLLLRLFKALLS